MIIGTAGHIDHGKTTLVRALSGVDTDRLPEEKRRGISIELGYAYVHADDGVSLGFVDVPGHERLLHTMLAGATGIDHALLVVAADDGVMPQTREHLAVVALLGLRDATIALTKVDRLDAATRDARLAALRADIAALLAPTALAGAPVFEVAASTGQGVQALRGHLLALARSPARRRAGGAHGAFRLAVDRAFTLPGVGTVVTGAAAAGRLLLHAADDTALRLVPRARPVRLRGIHAQNRPADRAEAGQRCALALAGVAKDEVRRGDRVCDAAIALESARLDVQLWLWPGEAQPLRSGTPLHVHLGTSDTLGSVALLDRDTLRPGDTAFAQLVLREPVAAWHGERGVLRDVSASRTLGGVRLLDPFAPTRYRRTPQRLRTLAAWALDGEAERLAALLDSEPLGLDGRRAARALGAADAAALPWPPDALRLGGAGHLGDAPLFVIARAHFDALAAQVLERLRAFHAESPDEVGPDARRLRRLAAPRTDDLLWRHLVEHLLHGGALMRSGSWLHLPEHAARLGAQEEQLAQKLLPRLLDGGFDPPWVRDLARDTATPEATVRQTLAGLARRGQAFQVVKDLYYPLATVERLAALARDCLAAPHGLQAASFRDASGLGRKRAIQILEFFDRVGYTRRLKDQHLLRPDTALFIPPPER